MGVPEINSKLPPLTLHIDLLRHRRRDPTDTAPVLCLGVDAAPTTLGS